MALMHGFPPSREDQVTLENWRRAPFNRWSFRNVRNVVPSAPIRRGERAAPLARRPAAIGHLRYRRAGGEERSVDELLATSCTDAFIVLRHGAIADERYYGAMQADDQHILMSMSKSVAGTLAGVLVERGALDPEAPVAAYVPEVAGSVYADVSVRHLLDMTVGVVFEEDYLATEGPMIRYREASGWKPRAAAGGESQREFLVSLRDVERPHGEAFHYVSPNSDLLGWVTERAAGEPWWELASEAIWKPMGAEHEAYVTVDTLGAPRTAGGVCTSLRDLARFGQLMLERGVANGRQVIPGAWVDDIRSNGDAQAWRRGNFAHFLPQGRYRSQWYQVGDAQGAIYAIGVYGQLLYVNPVANVVIGRFASQPAPVDDVLDAELMRAFDIIAASLAL